MEICPWARDLKRTYFFMFIQDKLLELFDIFKTKSVFEVVPMFQ